MLAQVLVAEALLVFGLLVLPVMLKEQVYM